MIRLCATLACGFLAASIFLFALELDAPLWRWLLLVVCGAWIVIAALVFAGHAGRRSRQQREETATERQRRRRERLRAQIMRGVP